MTERFARVDAILREATGTWFTGAVARIERAGKLEFEAAYGVTRDDEPARPVYVDTRFDLASITKLFVTTIALQAVERGVLGLDAPLVPLVREWEGTDHAPITLRMLLAHNSGMNSGADYRTLLDSRVEDAALRRPLAYVPGERVNYSDLGLIAAGVVLERALHASLPAIVRAAFPSASLRYVPRQPEWNAIPATEEDPWRGRVQGFVHDEKAYLMNGVAGHAGLFGTAADVAALTEAMLAAVAGRPQRLLAAPLAREAVSEAAYDPVLRRGLGWALKTNDENSCGSRFSSDSFGHTGFTGTCVWADPQRDLQGVLLTNTVYFGRVDSRPLRAAFYNALIEAYEG